MRNHLFFRAFLELHVYLFQMEWLRKHCWLLLILLVGIGVRALISVNRGDWPASSDEDHWERIGLIYATSGIGSPEAGTYRPPLYPLLIAFVYKVAVPDAVWVRIFQIVLSAATGYLVYRLGYRVGGSKVALVSACLASLYPLWAFISGMLMAETLLVFLVTMICFLGISYVQLPGIWKGIGLGVTLGLGLLCKPIILVWIPAVVFVLWRKTPPRERRVYLNQAVAILSGFLVVVVPWAVRNELVTGHRFLISSNFGMNLLVGHEPGARGSYREGRNYLVMHERLGQAGSDAIESDRLVAREVLSWIVEDPARATVLGAKKVFLFWNSVIEGAPPRAVAVHFVSGSVICILGIWGLFRHRADTLAWFVGSAAIAWTVVHAVFFAHPRFRLPIDIILLPFVASQLLVSWQWVCSAVRTRMAEL
jgi:4-amino-4-deoxy-L-arabinose transferase-like glycosyltransferase